MTAAGIRAMEVVKEGGLLSPSHSLSDTRHRRRPPCLLPQRLLPWSPFEAATVTDAGAVVAAAAAQDAVPKTRPEIQELPGLLRRRSAPATLKSVLQLRM